MNWKYKGEEIIRSAGLPYAIVRAVGLANVVLPDPTTTATPATAANTNASTATATPVDILLQPRKLEFNQGDIISGRIRRDELASVVVQALNSGEVIGKTFEVRRDESPSGQLQDTNWNHINGDIYQDQQNFGQLFRELQLDEDRAVAFQSNENNAEMTLRGSRFLPPFPYANDPFPPLVSFPPPPPPVVVANTASPSVASPSNDASAK